MSAGLDSNSATELTRALSEKARLEIPATLLFDHPTAADIISFVGGSLSADLATPAEAHMRGGDVTAEEGVAEADHYGIASPQSVGSVDLQQQHSETFHPLARTS